MNRLQKYQHFGADFCFLANWAASRCASSLPETHRPISQSLFVNQVDANDNLWYSFVELFRIEG
jgi:hypothetical protein